MKHNVTQIMEVKKRLASLPPITLETKEHLSSVEAVILLVAELASLQKKGYSTSQLVGVLHDQGIDISAATLRRHLRHAGVIPPPKKRPETSVSGVPTGIPRTKAGARKAPQNKSMRATSTEPDPAARNSAFPVRKDTEDL